MPARVLLAGEALADSALALMSCERTRPTIGEHFFVQELAGRFGRDLWSKD